MIFPKLTELVDRKLRAAQERTRTVMSQTEVLIARFTEWRTTKYAAGETRQAMNLIAAAREISERGTFLHYIDAERLATDLGRSVLLVSLQPPKKAKILLTERGVSCAR